MSLNSVVRLWTTLVIDGRSEQVQRSSHHNDKEETEHNQGIDGQEYYQGHNKSYPSIMVKPARFPPEIWCLIIMHVASIAGANSGNSSNYISNKVLMNWLLNLASTSRFHRQLVLTYWANTVHLLKQADPGELEALGAANGVDLIRRVRRLVCATAYQIYQAPKDAFREFKFIEELILNCHLDINFGGDGLGQQQNPHVHAGPHAVHAQGLNDDDHPHDNIPQPIPMSYRRLRVKLPGSLRTLRVYGSHVPDVYFIQQVVEQCPLLQSLTLARCTIFSRQECDFWKRLPRTESDAYFNDNGIHAYAVSRVTPVLLWVKVRSNSWGAKTAIGKELEQISHLTELNIGIYLTNHTAIDMHLEQHASRDHLSNSGLGIWEKPCEKCIIEYQEATTAAEREATEILAKEVPTLLAVSWASFCSERRTGWSTHQIMRDDGGYFRGLSSAVDGLAKC
ncbi:unnamed protein product [Rhizoctonia solani]|uniref:Uncharacterized protein n=1 Tax=Rhizoctonia solani TaxID=456999 RepID=A0A8H3AUI6_9AGAM|nr:unnamed protein product [Rhizoctonia solani]